MSEHSRKWKAVVRMRDGKTKQTNKNKRESER